MRGTTLAEMLVMMIVSGVVLLAVTEGFALFRGYTANLAGRIEENSSFYDGYYRLGELAAGADSITGENGAATLWRGGVKTELALHDSMLVAFYGAVSDTLMHGVERLAVDDSLVVVVRGLNLSYRK